MVGCVGGGTELGVRRTERTALKRHGGAVDDEIDLAVLGLDALDRAGDELLGRDRVVVGALGRRRAPCRCPPAARWPVPSVPSQRSAFSPAAVPPMGAAHDPAARVEDADLYLRRGGSAGGSGSWRHRSLPRPTRSVADGRPRWPSMPQGRGRPAGLDQRAEIRRASCWSGSPARPRRTGPAAR